MKRDYSILIFLGALAAIAAVGFSAIRWLQPSVRAHTLSVYCGNSMRPAAEELARLFEQRTGATVSFTFGGTEELFPQLAAPQCTADIFICHDPFGDRVRAQGLLVRDGVVGYLVPVIIVPKGNPRGIRGLADLLRPGLRAGTTDPRSATCGKMVEDRLREKGLAKSYEDAKTFVLQTRKHADVATALVAGQLDAGVVWNFVGQQFRDKVDCLSTGETWPETKVTACLVSTSKERVAAERFLALAASAQGRAVFTRLGYGKDVPAAEGQGTK